MDPALTQPLVFGAILAMLAFVLDRRERGRHESTKDLIRELKERVDRFETRVDRELEQVRAEIASLRSDLTQVALALRVHPQTG